MDMFTFDKEFTNYLGEALISKYPADELFNGRGGYVYIFKFNNNAYRLLADFKNEELIFQVLAVGYATKSGDFGYDDAHDYASVDGDTDKLIDIRQNNVSDILEKEVSFDKENFDVFNYNCFVVRNKNQLEKCMSYHNYKIYVVDKNLYEEYKNNSNIYYYVPREKFDIKNSVVDKTLVSDYSKYDMSSFSESHKKEMHEKQFPKDLECAFQMGVKLGGGA